MNLRQYTRSLAAGAAAAALALLAAGTAAHAQWGGDNGGYNGGGWQRDRDRGVYDSVRGTRLEGRLELDRSQYGPNRGVEIRLTYVNTGRNTQTLSPGRQPMYVVEVRDDRSGRVVRTFNGRFGTLRIAGDDDYTYREVWDQRDDSGRYVPAGTYRLEARFFGIPGRASVRTYLAGNGRGDDNGGGGWGRDRDRDRFPGDLGGRRDDDRSAYDSSRLRSDVTADRTRVRAGDRVTFTYTVTNTSRDTSQTLRFSSGKQFDVEVTDPRGNSVWQASRGMFYTQSLIDLTLRPGERRTFTVTWNVPRDARYGDYSVTAYLTPRDGGSQSAAARTRVTVE
jgi:hypothetical protein